MGGISTGDCTTDGCPVPNGFRLSAPSMVGSAIMLAAFGLLVPVNFFLAIHYRTALYSTAMIVGLALEVMGYVGRLLLREHLADRTYFVLYLLGTLLGPAFVAAAIFIILTHLLGMAPRHIDATLQPLCTPLYTAFLFFVLDISSLVFQAVGSVFATRESPKNEISRGINILIAGLGIQIGSLLIFSAILCWFLFKKPAASNPPGHSHVAVFRSGHFRIFILCLYIAAVLILVRTIYRLIEFIYGLDSILTQSQVLILVLDGAFTLLACIVLSIASPGKAFGSAWPSTSPFKLTSRSQDRPHQYQGDTHGSKQTTARWEQPGYQQSNHANYSPTHQCMASPDSSPRFERTLNVAPKPAGESDRKAVNSARRSVGASKKRQSEKRNTVDPEALWD